MELIKELRAIVGDTGVLEAADVATRSAGVWRPDNLKALALVRPANTEEVTTAPAKGHLARSGLLPSHWMMPTCALKLKMMAWA